MSEQSPVQSEPIRAWFERKTKKIRKAIIWSSGLAVIGSVVSFLFMPDKVIATLQVFNGAMTIPVFGGIWMVSFIFMFLLPSREAGFRSQEGIDEAKQVLAKAIDEKVGPAMDRISLVASRINAYMDGGIVEDIQSAVRERIVPAADCLNRVCQRVEASIVNAKILEAVQEAALAVGALCRKYEKAGVPDASQFMAEAKPVLEMLKNVQAKFEKDFGADFASDLKEAVASVRELGGMTPQVRKVTPQVPARVPAAPVQVAVPAKVAVKVQSTPVAVPERIKPRVAVVENASREPDMDRALAVLRRKKLEKVV